MTVTDTSTTITTSGWQFANTLFPDVDVDACSPSVADIAMLEHTRTIDEGGNEIGAFTADTRPTDAEVTLLIAQAAMIVLDQLDTAIAPGFYPLLKEAIALETAILVETSFFREQINQGAVEMYQAILLQMMRSLQVRTGSSTADGGSGGGPGPVDAIMVRGVMTEFDPYLPIPPPDPIFELVPESPAVPPTLERDPSTDDTYGVVITAHGNVPLARSVLIQWGDSPPYPPDDETSDDLDGPWPHDYQEAGNWVITVTWMDGPNGTGNRIEVASVVNEVPGFPAPVILFAVIVPPDEVGLAVEDATVPAPATWVSIDWGDESPGIPHDTDVGGSWRYTYAQPGTYSVFIVWHDNADLVLCGSGATVTIEDGG